MYVEPAGTDTELGLGTSADTVSWDAPTADQVGPHVVTLSAEDARGGTAIQTFTVVVHPAPGNHSPVITSTPVTALAVPAAETSAPYAYHARAVDPDGDHLTYRLSIPHEAQFAGGTLPVIDAQTGSITWDATPGAYDLAVRVEDGRGGSDQQAVHLVVSTVATSEIDGRVGISSVVFKGTDAIFLAGRDEDVTIPPAGVSTQDYPDFPLIRNTEVGSLAETFPQPITAVGGEPFSFQVGGVIDYANGAAGGFIGAEGNNALVDDAGAGFTASAKGWHLQHGGYGDTDLRAASADTTGLLATATWEVSGLPEGAYDLLASWQPDDHLATSATYWIYDGDTRIEGVTVDQTVAPGTGGTVRGTNFQTLGGQSFSITSGTLRIVLDNSAGAVDADAILLRSGPYADLSPVGAISGYRGPLGLVGVFLNDDDPSDPSPPETLDFTSAEGALGTDFASLSPQIGQVFFIGDGLTGAGRGAHYWGHPSAHYWGHPSILTQLTSALLGTFLNIDAAYIHYWGLSSILTRLT